MKSFQLALSIAVLSFVVCAGAYASGARRANSWTAPHVFTISDASEPQTLNPHFSQNAPTANMSEMTMAWLLRWNKHNELYPELATQVPSKGNGGISQDGLTVTYHLRRGVKWADGAPFSADDVVFSAGVVNNPANDEGARFDGLASVEEPDKYTVVAHLKKPDSTFLVNFFSSCCANPSLLPKHLLAQYPNINNVSYNSLPVGIGPFKFERWDHGKQVVMVADPLYWRGKPKLQKVIYRIIPDRDKLLAELNAHRVDMWYQFSGAYLERVAAIPGMTIIRRPSYAWNHVDFNITHAVVADPRVRQALRLGLNRPAIVQNIDHGVGVVKDAAMPLSAPYFSDMGAQPYDPARANALLDEAGWTRGADGIREKDGKKLQIVLATTAGRPDGDKQILAMQSNWKDIGVDMRIDRYPATQMFMPAQQGGIVYGDKWDAVIFAWAADPLGNYDGQFGCEQFPPTGLNNVRWCNKTAQAAMEALLGHYDQAQRTADVRTVMQEFIKDTPSIVLQIREDIFAYNQDLKNYDPNTVTPFDNMMNVDI